MALPLGWGVLLGLWGVLLGLWGAYWLRGLPFGVVAAGRFAWSPYNRAHPSTALPPLPAPPPNPSPPRRPADPKLLITRPDPEALSEFAVTTLERATRRELLLPSDLGVPITLLDADRYNVPAEVRGFVRSLWVSLNFDSKYIFFPRLKEKRAWGLIMCVCVLCFGGLWEGGWKEVVWCLLHLASCFAA